MAAHCGESEIADLLLLNGARVNMKDNKWLTPLHRSCCSKSEVCTDLFAKLLALLFFFRFRLFILTATRVSMTLFPVLPDTSK